MIQNKNKDYILLLYKSKRTQRTQRKNPDAILNKEQVDVILKHSSAGRRLYALSVKAHTHTHTYTGTHTNTHTQIGTGKQFQS